MSPVTHALSGWVLANAARLERRDELLVTVAAMAPDVDGLGLLVDLARHGWNGPHPLWYRYHHVLCHNLAFAVGFTVLAWLLARRLWVTAGLAFAGVHLHLLCDSVGSRGPDGYQWPIPYQAPFSHRLTLTWSGQWQLNAWPNVAFTVALLAAACWLAWRRGYSPVGLFSRRADAAFVATLRRRFGGPTPRDYGRMADDFHQT